MSLRNFRTAWLEHAWKRGTRYGKRMNFRKIVYFFHIISPQERRLILLLIAIMLASGGGLAIRFYLRLTTEVPAIGGSYTEGILREPHTVNPIFATQDPDRDISRLVFAGLLRYNGTGEVEPDLAETYRLSPDGRSYTLVLRPDLRWHDGQPLTADDVVFTVRTIQNPSYRSVLRANWQGISVEKVDDRTIRFQLRSAYAPFLENLTTGILPRHRWEQVGAEQALLHELNLKPVGAGPYAFDRFGKDKQGKILWYRLKRNQYYHREAGPYLERITLRFFSSEDSMPGALRKGTIDGFGPVAASRLLELNPKKISVHAIPMPRVFGLFFNDQKVAAFKEKVIREAIAYSLNRRELAERAISGGGIPTSSPLPLTSRGGDEPQRYPYDPERSREVLDTAKWVDADGDGVREKGLKEGRQTKITPLSFTLTTSDWPDLVRSAELIREMLGSVGIAVTIQKLPINELESTVLKPRNYELLLFGQVYGYEPDPFSFWHSSQVKDPGLNIALYASKRADQLLEESRTLTDAAARRKKYQEFAQILERDLPAVFLYSQLYLYLLPRDLGGVELERISLPSDRFNTVHRWYRETEREWK